MVLSNIIFAEQIIKTYYFDEPELISDSIYIRIEIPDGVVIGTPGYPALPYKGIQILLPQNENISEVIIETGNQISLGTHLVYPIQRQIPISDTTGIGFTEPDPVIYESSEQYPAEQNTDFSIHYLAGYSIGCLAITPLSYIPEEGELIYYESVTVIIETAYNSAAEDAANNFLFDNNPMIESRLQVLVENYEDKDIFYNPKRVRPDDSYDYIIVTASIYEDDFQPLADFYEQRGYRTKITLIQDILSSYSGVDDADRLRNYFTDEYNQHSFQYALLAGDTDIISHRGLYGIVNAGNPYEKIDYDIPSDMYYSCLDNTSAPGSGPGWNNDDDEKWGEPNEADLLSEFCIGRICVNNSTEIANFINKTIMYSENPVSYEIQNALLIGENLNWQVTGGDYLDELIGGCSTNGYITIGMPIYWDTIKLYFKIEPWGSEDLFPLLSNGPNLVNHLGHGNVTKCLGIYNSDLTPYNITNNGSDHNFFNGYSQACYSGSYDNRDPNGNYTSDCFTERITAMETGAATFIANSRYGWGNYSTTDGASQIFHRYWIDTFFGRNEFSIAAANQLSKEKAIPAINAEKVNRWCCYELNVFGDPMLQLWTESPECISASYNSVLYIGQTSFEITNVNCDTGRVAIHFNDEIIAKGDIENGSIELNIFDPPSNTGTAVISILSHNYYFYQDEISVIPFSYAVIEPESLPINELTEVMITVYQDDKGTPLPGVNVEAYGPGIFGDTLGVTDEDGVCVLNFGAEYGGNDLVKIKGWESGAGYYIFDEAIPITDGINLTNSDLTVTTSIGIIDTFAMNLPGRLHSVVEEDNCMLWYKINNSEWQNTAEDSIEIIPEELGIVTGMITKSGYNVYQEAFPIKRVYGTVSGIVTDTNANFVDDAKISIYTLEGSPVVTTYTDENGEYILNGTIPVGEYIFTIERFSYAIYEDNQWVQYGENTINIELDFAETYTVNGMICYGENDPGTAAVNVYRNDNYELVDSLECISETGVGIFTTELVNYAYLFEIESFGYEVLDTVIVVDEDNMWAIFIPEPHDYVKDVPDEYPNIQSAINACVDGDTVLVYTGTYYENINYLGKNITVGSPFLTEQDPSYIEQTIISGDNGGSVVTFENGEDTTAILTGFTITQGSGKLIETDGELISYGGGIYCGNESSATLSHLIVKENTAQCGAGMWIDHDNIQTIINDCVIAENNATSAGGGMAIRNHSATLINCSIINNFSDYMAGAIFGYSEEINLRNCILWNNSQSQETHCYFASGAVVSISYSDIEEGESGIELVSSTLIWDEGNISDDPCFTDPDNGDYSLTWNNTVRSPCIDTGDPDIVYNDADETRADMGAIPAIAHNYDCRTLKEGWNWFSFPVLDTVTTGNVDALIALDPILDNMEECQIKELRVWWNPEIWDWVNDIGDFRSVDGYKIQMNAPDTLPISGFLEDPDAVITLEAETEYGNWIGYFIEHSMKPQDAFTQVWDKLTYIKAQNWTILFDKQQQAQQQGVCPTVDYGKSYVVGVSENCNFTWGLPLQPADPYEKSETVVFIYEEQSDYMPIFVDSTEALNAIDEIGVFLEDECIGASVIEGFPVFISAYVNDDSTHTKGGDELTFLVASYGKSEKRSIPVFLYNEAQDLYVEKPVILDNNSYALVRLGTGAGIELPKEFTVYQNYPNPFSCNFGKSTTTISFMPSTEAENSEIRIYNTKGQLVKQFKIQNSKNAMNEVAWDGKDDHGTQLGNGIYFYKVSSGKKSAIKKMVILR